MYGSDIVDLIHRLLVLLQEERRQERTHGSSHRSWHRLRHILSTTTSLLEVVLLDCLSVDDDSYTLCLMIVRARQCDIIGL